MWALSSTAVDGANAPTRRPNILLITADTFRADHIGYDGYPHPTSPHLDSLSAEGVFFRRAFTTSGWTAPGLISIHTSLYAPSHGVDVRGRSLDPSVTTLAEALRAVGYRTPDIFFLTDIPNFQNLGLEPWPRRMQLVHEGDEILFRWLEQEAGSSDQPFFLYYHYRDLHQPYNPGPEYEDLFAVNAFGHPWNPLTWVRRFVANEKVTLVQREVMLLRGIIDFSPWDKRWIDAFYDGQVRRMDERLFGRLRQVMKTQGLLDNTIIVVSADHGEELLEDGLVGHASTFKEARLEEEVARIPLIFHGPDWVPVGQINEDLVQAIDVMPTLLEMAGAPIPVGVQGRSLVPLFEGGSLPPRPVFLETSAGGYTADLEQYATRARAIRTERWKLVWHTPADAVELYDVVADPQARQDRAAAEPHVADSLKALLADWANTHPRIGSDTLKPLPDSSVGNGATGAAAAIEILFPSMADTLEYIGAGQTIELAWSGGPGDYTVEYDIGRGAYHLEGELQLDSNTPSYGPFHADFWNSLVLYNPWRFRVLPRGRKAETSDWVSFDLAPSDAVGWSLAGAALVASTLLQQTSGEMLDLAVGLPPAGTELAVWLRQIPAADAIAWALLLTIAAALVWPPLQRFGEGRVRAWGIALAYVLFVFLTVPVFPEIWVRLRHHTGAGIAHVGTILVGAVAAWCAVHACRRALAERALWRLPVLLLVLASYAWILRVFGQFPAERLHLLEYGFMAFVLQRALRFDLPTLRAYAWALGLTALLGFVDESIQWVLPQRFFELKDVALNVMAGSLGLALVALARGAAGHRQEAQ